METGEQVSKCTHGTELDFLQVSVQSHTQTPNSTSDNL